MGRLGTAQGDQQTIMNPEDHTIIRKLDEIIETLKRIEDRQVIVKAEIEDKPVVGSFASSEPPSEHERTGH